MDHTTIEHSLYIKSISVSDIWNCEIYIAWPTIQKIPLYNIDIECVSPRKETYTKGSRKPIVSQGGLQDDVYRRDFTVNSLLYNISTKKILDITGKGKSDIKNGIIRTTQDPDIILRQDGLRLLRAIRFATKYNWKLEPNLYAALSRNANCLNDISKERIQEEFNKMLQLPNCSVACKMLVETNMWKHIFPAVKLSSQKLQLLEKASCSMVKLAVLFHDVPANDIEHSLKSLKYPNQIVLVILNVVSFQDFFKNERTIQKIREFRWLAGKDVLYSLELISLLHKSINVASIATQLKKLGSQPIKSPVSGNDLVKMGVTPGPQFKKLLSIIQAKFEENPELSKDELLSLISPNKDK